MQIYKTFYYFYVVNAIFIKLSKEQPIYRNGYGMNIFSFRGVRLLPNEENAYIQRTNVPNGINFDDPTVEALTPCGTIVADLTENFEQIQSFDDPETGFTQIYWGLKNLPDLGNQLIYLRITNGADGYAYSTPFAVYGLENETDVPPYRFDYRDEDTDVMQSIGLELYYYKDAEIFEQESYDTVGGDSRVVLNSKLIEYEICRSSIVDYKLLREFKRMMCFSEKYCDYEAVTLIEVPETPDFTGDENFVQYEVSLLRDSVNVYDPNFVPPVPPPPPANTIVLQSVVGVNPTQVNYTFTVNGFTPNYLNYQYSLDGVNWIDDTNAPTSPATRTRANYTTANYYYRITARPAYEVDSNVVQLTAPSIVLSDVYSLDPSFNPTGNDYMFVFTVNNLVLQDQLKFDASPDGVSWTPYYTSVYFAPGNNSPKLVETASSGVQFKYFRVRYNPLNLVSNTKFFQF